jgi:hypothetical protein
VADRGHVWENEAGGSSLHIRVTLPFLLIAALAAGSCGSVTAPSDNVTDTFSGTLKPRGLEIHPFSVSNSGEVEVKITALAPNSNVFLGTVVGQPQADGACAFSPLLSPNEFSTVNIASVVGPIQKGNWCVGIYDPLPGRLATEATYTLQVKHP